MSPRARGEHHFPYVWFTRSTLPDRKGDRCRKVLKPGQSPFPRKVTVEFEDGHQEHNVPVTAIRRAA